MTDFSEKTCLFAGRFQPFHTGHLLVLQGMVKSCKKVIIAVGSSDETDTKENPFDIDERREMIQRALQGVDIIPRYDIDIIPVPDIPDDDKWVDHMKELAGPFDAIWSGNELVSKCCTDAGVEVKEIKEVPGISSTGIRDMMRDHNTEWKNKVPDEVASYLSTIN